jgi:hypothetical protein
MDYVVRHSNILRSGKKGTEQRLLEGPGQRGKRKPGERILQASPGLEHARRRMRKVMTSDALLNLVRSLVPLTRESSGVRGCTLG